MEHPIIAGSGSPALRPRLLYCCHASQFFYIFIQNEQKRFMGKTNIKALADETTEERKTQRLWLVRHGFTEWNAIQRFCGHSDIPLSAAGRAQARWLARRLQREKISCIYTSDLARARETAEIIANSRAVSVQVKVSAAWREIDFGAWEGLTYAEIAAGFEDQLSFFTDLEHSSPPGGESPMHMVKRVQIALTTIAWTEDMLLKGDAVIVSHGGPLRALLCSMLGMSLERQWQLCLDPGSFSTIDLLLPIQDPAAPLGILASLNVQSPTPFDRFAMPSDQGRPAGVLGASDDPQHEASIYDD
jgi:broad specificity phosphatase PhoE